MVPSSSMVSRWTAILSLCLARPALLSPTPSTLSSILSWPVRLSRLLVFLSSKETGEGASSGRLGAMVSGSLFHTYSRLPYVITESPAATVFTFLFSMVFGLSSKWTVIPLSTIGVNQVVHPPSERGFVPQTKRRSPWLSAAAGEITTQNRCRQQLWF